MAHRHHTLIALFLLFFPCLAWSATSGNTHYKVAVDTEYAPYEFKDNSGEITGMLPDLLRAIGKSAGVTFEFIPMTWPDAVKALQQGDVDLLNMIRTPERAARYTFSQPHSVIDQALFRNIQHQHIQGVDTIDGSKVALQQFDIAIEKLADHKTINRVMVTSKEQGFLHLNNGDVAAFFVAEQPGLYFLRNHELPNVKAVSFGLWPQDFCFASQKGNDTLIALLNTGLNRLKHSGEYDTITRHWLIKPPNWFSTHSTAIVITAVILVTVLLALWLWVFLLRRTVHRRTQELTEESERYRLLFESNMDAIMLLEKERFTDCNAATLKVFGCPSRAAFIRKHPGELSPPTQPDGTPSVEAAHQRITAALAQGRLEFEWVHRKFDGTDFIASVSLSTLSIDNRSILHATVRDITELVHGKKLRSLRQRLQEILLQPENDLAVVLNHIVREVELEVPDLLCSVLLLDDNDKLHHGAAPSLPDAYCQAIDGLAIGPAAGSCGTAAFTGKRVVVTDIANDSRWKIAIELAATHHLAACWSEPILDEYSKVLGTFAMYYRQPRAPLAYELDIIQLAAEVTALAILRSRSEIARKRAFAIIETSSDFVGMADSSGHAMYVNPAGRQMVGIAADEDITTMSISDFHPPADAERLMTVGFPQLNIEGSYRTTINFIHRNGEKISTTAAFSVQKHANGTADSYAVIAHDIRQELQQQQRIEHTQRLESLGILAGGIAHDFNNILTAIMGNAAMAVQKIEGQPDALPKLLDNIVNSSEKAAELCKQMLAYSGKGKFVIKPLNLSQMVEEVTKLLKVSIAKSVVLKYHLCDPLPSVEADAAQMQQVIMNLVINASDAIGDNSGVISIDTGIMDADRHYLRDTCLDENIAEGRYVFLEVSDTGCGMDRATQQRIFDPFFTTKFTGRGLGMSAVLGIIRGHQGTLKLYSEPGRGTSFKMLLPISDHAELTSPQSNATTDGWQGSGTILIVDDEESIRESAAMMLEDMGFATLMAADGIEGVELYRQFQDNITAVLLDMTMPRLDGKGCFSEIIRINPEAKVILSSGYNEQEATSHFSGRGLAGFVQKPYFPETLIKAMQEML
ncbi:MAG: transporter substrate-binding domain-containing protein [Mariprofundales bacterium]